MFVACENVLHNAKWNAAWPFKPFRWVSSRAEQRRAEHYSPMHTWIIVFLCVHLTAATWPVSLGYMWDIWWANAAAAAQVSLAIFAAWFHNSDTRVSGCGTGTFPLLDQPEIPLRSGLCFVLGLENNPETCHIMPRDGDRRHVLSLLQPILVLGLKEAEKFHAKGKHVGIFFIGPMGNTCLGNWASKMLQSKRICSGRERIQSNLKVVSKIILLNPQEMNSFVWALWNGLYLHSAIHS